MSLSESQKKALRRLGHALKPVVRVGGSGLTQSVYAEFDACLTHHELIKVQVKAGDRQRRDTLIRELAARSAAELVQRIGNIALFYRQNSECPRVTLPPA